MLVLSRKRNQEIVVEGPCTIRLLDIKPNKVSLGFIGPTSTIVKRSELPGSPRPETTFQEFYSELTGDRE